MIKPIRRPTLEEIRAWPALVDIEDAGRALGIGRTTAYNLAQAGQLPVKVIMLGRQTRIVTASLIELLEGK